MNLRAKQKHYASEAAKIERDAETGRVLTANERKEYRDRLKGDDGEQVMIRLSGSGRAWLDMNKVAETEVETERVPPAPPANDPPKNDNKPE
jgi:urease accessory protein UreE